MFNFEWYQVYEEPGGAPFRGNRNLATSPRNMEIMDVHFKPDWGRWIEDHWKIRVHIRNGNISINFPDIDLEKVNTADLHSIDGVYVLRFFN